MPRSSVSTRAPKAGIKVPTRKVKTGEVTAKRRTKKAVEEPPAKPTKKLKAAEVAAPCFNPYTNLDSTLDSIEKHIGLTDGGMEVGERRMSTGLLMNDLILGGGITAGWYTNFGQEQTCKTTNAVTMLASAVNTDVPIIVYFDFEGCLSYDTQVTVNGKQQHLGDLFVGLDLKPYIAFDTRNLNITVESPCGPQHVVAASYKGCKPITHIEVEGGADLDGYKHPVLVCTSDGLLEWKYLEELNVGDLVVTKSETVDN